MPPTGIQRTVYKTLLRGAKAVEGTSLLPIVCEGRVMQAPLSGKLKRLIEEGASTWGSRGEGLIESVRQWSRDEEMDLETGIEGCRMLCLVKTVNEAPMTPFKEGDVVRHRVLGDVGVIISTHPRCAMGTAWLTRNVGSPTHPFATEPWYDIVLDQQYGGFTRHGAHRNHEVIQAPVDHPLLRSEGWSYDPDAGKYTPPK